MPLILPDPLRDNAARPYPTTPFAWLWELTLEVGDAVTPTTVVRLVAHDAIVELDPVTKFYPFPLSQSPIDQTAKGDLPQMTLTVDNRQRWLMPYLDSTDGFLDLPARAYLVNLESASIANAITFGFRVSAAEATSEAVTFRLELPNFFTRNVPTYRFQAQVCQWDFGSPECGYVVNALAAYTTCSKDLAACILRGQDELLRRLPVRHPRRIRLFRGVATSRV